MQIFLFFVEEHVAELECLISWSGMVVLCFATVFCGYLNQPPRKLAVRHLFLSVLHTLHSLTMCPLVGWSRLARSGVDSAVAGVDSSFSGVDSATVPNLN